MPNAPTNLTGAWVKEQGSNYIRLDWVDNSDDELTFELQFSWRDPGGEWTEFQTAIHYGPDVTFTKYFGLNNRRDWRFQIRATGTGEPSAFSNIVEVPAQH